MVIMYMILTTKHRCCFCLFVFFGGQLGDGNLFAFSSYCVLNTLDVVKKIPAKLKGIMVPRSLHRAFTSHIDVLISQRKGGGVYILTEIIE